MGHEPLSQEQSPLANRDEEGEAQPERASLVMRRPRPPQRAHRPDSLERSAATVTPLRRPHSGGPSDEELVRRMLLQDAWAKEAFYRRHVAQAYRVAHRLLRHHEDTEDVVQEAFSQAFADLPQLREPQAVRVWLMRIVVHRVHRRFRKKRVLRLLGLERCSSEELLTGQPASGVSPEQCAEFLLIEKALQTASLANRSAWFLRHAEGYSLPEVAEACGCSLATAKRRIKAVDDQLAGFLGKGDRHVAT